MPTGQLATRMGLEGVVLQIGSSSWDRRFSAPLEAPNYMDCPGPHRTMTSPAATRFQIRPATWIVYSICHRITGPQRAQTAWRITCYQRHRPPSLYIAYPPAPQLLGTAALPVWRLIRSSSYCRSSTPTSSRRRL
ncbi:uncharacterized protein LOC144173712 [Haemaphysalis longicornis]